MPKKVGIMGGTFDPPHIGHLAIAEQARDALSLDRVLFIPAGTPVFKKDRDVTPASLRLEMCRAAVAGNPGFAVSDIEVRRGGDTYTVDTLHQLKEAADEPAELYLLLGSDAFSQMGEWRDVDEVVRLAKVVVLVRPGSEAAADAQALARYNAVEVPVTQLDVSSSMVRRRVREGRTVRYLVPDGVYHLIQGHGLYRG